MAEHIPRLIVRFGSHIYKVVELTQPEVRIGSDPRLDLTLPGRDIGTTHAELRVEPGSVLLTHLDAHHYTYVNDTALQVNEPCPLTDGAVFSIGRYTLFYQAGAAAPGLDLPPADVPAADAPPERDAVPAVAEPLPADMPSPDPGPLLEAGPPEDDTPIAPPTSPHAEIAPWKAVEYGEDIHRPGRYLENLPIIFQIDYDPRNEFLGRYLRIFENIWEPLEQRQDAIDMYFHPRTCPRPFLSWMAHWMGLPFDLAPERTTDVSAAGPGAPEILPEASQSSSSQMKIFLQEDYLRSLLCRGMVLQRSRGTLSALQEVITLCTGLRPVITEDPLQPMVVRIRVALPEPHDDQQRQHMRSLLEALIDAYKPAPTGYILEI